MIHTDKESHCEEREKNQKCSSATGLMSTVIPTTLERIGAGWGFSGGCLTPGMWEGPCSERGCINASKMHEAHTLNAVYHDVG